MALRFRKSIGKGPLRVNISKKGIGASIGGKGYRFTKKAGGGTRSTASLPGTGISHVSESSKKGKNYGSAPSASTPISTSTALRFFFKVIGIFTILASLLLCLAVPAIGIIGLIIGFLEVTLSSKKKQSAQSAEENEILTTKNS